MNRVLEFVGRKIVWLTALLVFWVVWFNFPSLTVGIYDFNIWVLKGAAKVLSVLPYVSWVDGMAQLLNDWVGLIKSATRLFHRWGGERTELVLRTMAFEGIVFWWEVKFLVALLARMAFGPRPAVVKQEPHFP